MPLMLRSFKNSWKWMDSEGCVEIMVFIFALYEARMSLASCFMLSLQFIIYFASPWQNRIGNQSSINNIQIIYNLKQMQDSLELSKPSPKRKSPSPIKQDKERALQHQIKQKFIIALSKLQSSQTREIGMQEIRLIVDRNREPDHLRMFLAVMKGLKVQGTSSSAKEHQILVFSVLAEIFKENLVDPIDKPTPSRVKTCFRIIQILHTYFKETSNTVQQACARVLIDLSKHVLGAQSENPSLDTETFLTLLFSPLASILKSGVDKASQSTASVCINEQIQYWRAHSNIPKYREMLDLICPEMLAVALKLNCEYHEIFMALETVIEMKGLAFFGNKLVQFVSKILGVINKINNNKMPQDASNFNNYMCKVNVCGILERIGELIRDKPEIKGKLDELDVIPCLEKATRNRVIQVQMAAARAMKVWNGEQVSPQMKGRPASSPRIGGSKGQIMSLEQARNIKKRQRSGSKEEKLKLERELNHIQEDLHKLVKGGWGPHNRANNFVKKNTGVGGGYCSRMDESSPSPKVNKSHKQRIDQLRKFIKDSSKEHGNKQKFVFYQEKEAGAKPKNKYNQDKEVVKLKNNQKAAISSVDKNKQKRAEKDEAIQFILDESHGDQTVNFPPQQRNYLDRDTHERSFTESEYRAAQKKVNSPDLSGIMNQEEMRSLLGEEKQILDLESKRQINSKLTVEGKNEQKAQKGAERYGEMTFNAGSEKKVQKSKFDNFKEKEKQKIKSQRSKASQMEFIMDEDHGDQMVNLGPQKKELKPQKQSQENIPNPYAEELSLDEVNNTTIPIHQIMNESDFDGLDWNPFKPKPIERVQSESAPNQDILMKKKDETKAFQQSKDDYKDSLVLSLSKGSQSRSRSPPKSPELPPSKNPLNQSKKTQFSLNPKQTQPKPNENLKFNSFTQNPHQQDQEQEQILDESKYEESVPYGQKLPVPQQKEKEKIEDYYKKSVQHGQELDKKAKLAQQPQQKQKSSQVFQEMIKNPPRSHLPHRLDRASQLKSQPSQSQSQNSIDQEPQQNENITDIWQRVLQHIENNELNEAYSLTFQMDDPIYLLRLMLITQTPLKKLTPANTAKLWQKFLEIYQHRFIDNIFVQMFSTAHRLGGGKGLRNSLSIEETNQLLVQLYELSGRSKGKLSFGAASLYNQIQESINGRTGRG